MSLTRHQHILNLSALEELMADPPKAQRLTQAINKGKLERLTKEQTENFLFLVEQETKKTIDYIRTKSPYFNESDNISGS